MSQSPLKTRLGKRLRALFSIIPVNTDHFLDLCCDHGALGRAVLETQSDCHVVFNDIHPGIMRTLGETLTHFRASNFSLDVGPAQNIQLPRNGKTIVMLAGVGDEQCIEIIEHLVSQQTDQPVHLIISPATKVHKVRGFLASSNVGLVDEQLVTENRRTYEIIHVVKNDSQKTKAVSQFGEAWQPGNTDHQQHLEKLIQFYDAQQHDKRNRQTADIVEQYKKILKKIS